VHIGARGWAAAVGLGAASLAFAAPDEEALGKADGYPYARFGPSFSLFNERYRIGTFTHMEEIFWPRTIAASASPRVLRRAENELQVTYPFEGRTLTVDDLLGRQRIMGLLVLKGDTIVLERYQYGRSERDKFASFSMAKTVTGLLTGIALKEGAIGSLDDRASRYAPALDGTAFGDVSIRNLLRMSSGARWSDKAAPGQDTQIGRLTGDTWYRRGPGGADAIRDVRDSDAKPGARFNYSSAETFALGLALRGAVKKDLATYAAEKLWQPMGAETAASWLTDASGMEAAFCCINATLRDYARLGLLLADDGERDGMVVVPRDFLLDGTDAERQPEYLKPRHATQYVGYGYQTWIYPFRTRTFEARGLFGQQIVVQPESRVVVVLVSALATPDMPSAISVERNYFLGAVLKALGGRADVYH
jgi:CubicO group peptidase (beta-lactamase class C family)